MLQPRFVAVVGDRNSGKSTIIQSLSGCKNHSFSGIVTDTTTDVSIYVHAASPQERPKTDFAAFKKILKTAKTGPSIQGIVIAVQPTNPTAKLSLEDMFEFAKEEGFLGYAFVLDPPRNWTARNAFDKIAHRVLSIDSDAKVFQLDGRSFAVLNAQIIRATARIPY